MANKILDLLDNDFIYDYLNKNILPLYPQFKELKNNIKISPKKKNIWTDTYHVVFEYNCTFVDNKNDTVSLSIFCTAHDSEPRQVVYENLSVLADNNFSVSHLISPIPLFYSSEYNATFYQGIDGKTLYHYIKSDNRDKVLEYIPQTAEWFAKLHTLELNLHKEKLQLQSMNQVVPGIHKVMQKISELNPELLPIYKSIYDELQKREELFFKNSENIKPIHGDAHSENIIIAYDKYVAVIDFADMCLSDFARDLGCFMQQLDFKIMNITSDQPYADQVKKIFLENYLKNVNIKMTPDLDKRIQTYYSFTQMRTATFFLVKHNPQPERSMPLINAVIKNLNLNITI